jgi:SAM-dependent methyltransferase
VSPISRTLRWLRWRWAKRCLTCGSASYLRCFKWSERQHHVRVEDLPADTQAYEKLALSWNDYSSLWVRDYGQFLASAARYYGQPMRRVLDIGCGTGVLSRQIAQWAESVVGLDVSESMLREARRCTGVANIRYVAGDFRDFDLQDTFDAAVCGQDSLSYVDRPEQLKDVFRSVCKHLLPGGLFAFDALDEARFWVLANRKHQVSVGGKQFEVYYFYDAQSRVSESRVVFEDAVERHRRIPLEVEQIYSAAKQAGMEVKECFRADLGGGNYYLLRKP